MEKQFEKDLDELVRNSIGDIASIINKHSKYKVFKINFQLDPDKLDKILVNYFKDDMDDINVLVEIDTLNKENQAEIIFYYKKKEVEAQGHYILPKNFKPVSIYRILKECIKQDTNTPDIKSLEMGEN